MWQFKQTDEALDGLMHEYMDTWTREWLEGGTDGWTEIKDGNTNT